MMGAASGAVPGFFFDASLGYHPYAGGLDGARRKNATRETTAPLKSWLNEHRKNPYPTKAEKIMLALLTKMTLTQVYMLAFFYDFSEDVFFCFCSFCYIMIGTANGRSIWRCSTYTMNCKAFLFCRWLKGYADCEGFSNTANHASLCDGLSILGYVFW